LKLVHGCEVLMPLIDVMDECNDAYDRCIRVKRTVK